MNFRSLPSKKNLYGRRLILRLDLNVPLSEGKIIDDFKIDYFFEKKLN